MILAINAFAHLLVDAVCASTIFGALKSKSNFIALVFLYNTLAFSTQCLVGLAADRLRKHPQFSSCAMLLIALGFLLPVPAVVRIALIGLGNSVFHVASGAMTLEASGGKAGPLGVFVAPGAVGLTLGTLFPFLGKYFAALLFLAAGALPLASAYSPAVPAVESAFTANERRGSGLAPVLLLTAAVAVRAIGGSAVRFTWNTTQVAALVLTGFVFAGKTLGGFVCDRFGAKNSALLSVPLAAVLIAFLSRFAVPSVIGQLALNLTMPITLYLMYRAMPDSPAFAFGLAASALWPGTVIGKLLTLTGPALWIFVMIAFLFGLFAILYSERSIRSMQNGENRQSSRG